MQTPGGRNKCDTTGKNWPAGSCSNIWGDKFDYMFFGDRGLRLIDCDVVNRKNTVSSRAYKDNKLSDHWRLEATIRPVTVR
ncbi:MULTISPECIES: hypothetical protein [Streptomyces violaceusniger group]|uniref:Uncharacterized protein n=2 Tax=Streptomyces rhizosphaericus TaxID=114699 RepID=A0ABN1SQF5_9ACTN|nr:MULTISPECIES: hypothetical protein [Streptomyces violaceusniger group]